MRLALASILVFFLVFEEAKSQSSAFEFGFSLGTSVYSGDLDPNSFTDHFQNLGFAKGGFLRVRLFNNLKFRLNVMNGDIQGTDALGSEAQQLRNLNFTNNLTEIGGLLEYDLWDISPESYSKWTPFVSAGVAFLNHNPKTTLADQIIELQPLGTEGQGLAGFDDFYSKNIFVVPLGAGVKFRINDKITIQGDVMGRFTFFDYLDDVSTNYVSAEDFLENGRALSAQLGDRTGELPNAPEIIRLTGDQRGNPNVNDYYFTTMLSVVVNISKSSPGVGCPTW